MSKQQHWGSDLWKECAAQVPNGAEDAVESHIKVLRRAPPERRNLVYDKQNCE